MAIRQFTSGFLLAFIVSLPGLTQASPAAGSQPPSTSATQQPARPAPNESNPLNLTEEQKAKLRPILLEERQLLDTLRSDSSLGQEQKIQKASDIRSGVATKIRAILTAEQLQRLLELEQKNKDGSPKPSQSPTVSDNPRK